MAGSLYFYVIVIRHRSVGVWEAPLHRLMMINLRATSVSGYGSKSKQLKELKAKKNRLHDTKFKNQEKLDVWPEKTRDEST